jgi:hypothetical protein
MSNIIDTMADAAKAFKDQAKKLLGRRRGNLNTDDAIAWRNDFNLFDPYAATSNSGVGANLLPEATAYCFSSRDRTAKQPTEWGA